MSEHDMLDYWQNNFYNGAVRHALDQACIVAVTDECGNITYVNELFCEISKYRAEELLGRNHRILKSGHHSKEFYQSMWEQISSGAVWEGEIRNRAKDGSLYWVKTTIVPITDPSTNKRVYISIRSDITAGKELEEKQRQSILQNFNEVLSQLQILVFKLSTGSNGKLVFTMCEGELARSFGLSTEYVFGKTYDQLFHPQQASLYEQHALQALRGEQVHYETQHGDSWYYVILSPVQDSVTGKVIEIVGSTININERKQMEESLRASEERFRHLAYHDMLTGLPNRLMFMERLKNLLRGYRGNGHIAVMLLDLDNFKDVNDTLGHKTGDKLLQQVAKRLVKWAGTDHLIARVSGDEFMVAISRLPDEQAALAEARKLLDLIGKPLRLGAQTLYISGSIGISMYPGEETPPIPDVIMKHADIAMYRSKELGRNECQLHLPQMNDRVRERSMLERELRNALQAGEFRLVYQPKVQLRSGTIDSVEALLRWRSPELGNVPPMKFIPIAEETGFILPLGEWVLRTACEQAAAWLARDMRVQMCVNVSARQLEHHTFLPTLKSVLAETKLPPELLQLELTESCLMRNPARATQLLAEIKQLGASIAIDDFGTGFSSLSYLQHFPLDTLKIDRSFISNLENGEKDSAIAKIIILLARNLSLNVTAEGVETAGQAELLKKWECETIQGYYISPPVELEEVERLLGGSGTAAGE